MSQTISEWSASLVEIPSAVPGCVTFTTPENAARIAALTPEERAELAAVELEMHASIGHALSGPKVPW